MPNNNSEWTEERIQFLRDNYKTMVARQIANELGDVFSRNAIIGKARRLGLQADFRLRPHRSSSGELVTTLLKVQTRQRRAAVDEIRMQRLRSTGHVDIMGLESWHCREIVQEKPGVLYCGKHKTDDSSYCLEHHNKNHHRLNVSKVERYYGL